MSTIKYPDTINLSTGKMEYSEGNISIEECLGLLLSSSKGELLGDPNYGCNLREILFENNEVLVKELAINDIINAVATYEPRVRITSSDIVIETIEDDPNKRRISIGYRNLLTGRDEDFELVMFSGGDLV